MSASFVEMIKGFYQDEMNDHLTYRALLATPKIAISRRR